MASNNSLSVAPTGRLRAGISSVMASAEQRAVVYLIALVVAEALIAFASLQLGMILHGLILLVLLVHAALLPLGFQQRFLVGLALVPLIRLLSLSLPLQYFPNIYRQVVVGIPLATAAILAIRVTKMSRGMLGLTWRKFPLQILVGLSGVGLGYVEYLILRPEALVDELRWEQLWLPATILLIFTGLLEEVIFRGLLQYSALRLLRRWGIAYVALLFAALHLGHRSLLEVFFILAVALFYGEMALRTGSILGIALSHGSANIALYLVFPLLMAGPSATQLPSLEIPWAAVASPAPGFAASPTVPMLTASPEAAEREALPVSTAIPTGIPAGRPTLAPSPTFTSPPAPVEPGLVDDGDPGFTSQGGQQVSSEEGQYGDLLLAPATRQPGGDVQASWFPNLPACGRYEVEVYIPAGYAATHSAEYLIGYRKGMLARLVDQSAHPGGWADLGSYDFLPTKGTFLRLTNATGEDPDLGLWVLFDAARWRLVEPCD